MLKRLFASRQRPFDLEDHIRGVVYGQCIGDAIGLLTEFMTKEEAKRYYGKLKKLEYNHKISDFHRGRWETGDWTDDSDQMILILQSLLENKGEVVPVDFARRLKAWARAGFPDLGDSVGMGIGANTSQVLRHEKYRTDPHEAAIAVWEKNGGTDADAPNGGVMRTAILGVHQFDNIDDVVHNTLEMCKVTHADPRCQASCVAVTAAIAFMLQRNVRHLKRDGKYDVKVIRQDAYDLAKKCLPDHEMHAKLKRHMFVEHLNDLSLDEAGNMGDTYKSLGAGFWALTQKDYRKALHKLVMAAGDADTNGAVAGALLGCKLGFRALPKTWLKGLKHKDWLDDIFNRYISAMWPQDISPD